MLDNSNQIILDESVLLPIGIGLLLFMLVILVPLAILSFKISADMGDIKLPRCRKKESE